MCIVREINLYISGIVYDVIITLLMELCTIKILMKDGEVFDYIWRDLCYVHYL